MTAKDDLLLGVDGGGLTTQAVVATVNGEVLGRGLGPPSNHHRVGIDSACQALRTAIDGAFAQIPIARAAAGEGAPGWAKSGGIARACFGLAGVDSPQDAEMFSSWLADIGCNFKYTIGNDSELIL